MITPERWATFMRDMKSTNKRTVKLQSVPRYDDLRSLLVYVFSPQYTTGVTAKAINKWHLRKKRPRVALTPYNDLMSLMRDLCDRRLTGHAALESISRFLRLHPKERDELVALFGGNPRLGIELKQVNRALQQANKEPLCDVYECALALPFKDSDFTEEALWYIMRKYDGVRLQIHLNAQGKTAARSRLGNLQTSLDEALAEVQAKLNQKGGVGCDYILDGECCVVDAEGKEDFQAAVSVVRGSKPLQHFRFVVFDILTPEEFHTLGHQHMPTRDWVDRLTRWEEVSSVLDSRFVKVPMEHYSEEALVRWNKTATMQGWEGLMLRKNTRYEAGKTRSLLKVKTFHTAEYVVKDITASTKEMLNDRGVKVEQKVMGAAIIMHKGRYNKVGSGWSDAQRLEYFTHPERIIGKTIEVQYFEETDDGNLRFPTLKHVWGNRREL